MRTGIGGGVEYTCASNLTLIKSDKKSEESSFVLMFLHVLDGKRTQKKAFLTEQWFNNLVSANLQQFFETGGQKKSGTLQRTAKQNPFYRMK